MAIDRVGQKVRCVMSFGIETSTGETAAGCPTEGTVYTVGGFEAVHHPVAIDGVTHLSAPGIHLGEIRGICCLKCARPMSWPIVGFAPVDERETDISEIVRKALDVPAPKVLDPV